MQRPGPVPDVQRIVVLRPNAIGDFVFTLPALHALRQAYPQAHITLIGQRWHVDFLRGRPGPWDAVAEIPLVPGVGAALDDPAIDPPAIERFVRSMRERRFDLALQVFGGGRWSNPFIRRFGARLNVGLCADDAPPLDRCIPYHVYRNERLRFLEVVGLVGAVPCELSPRLVVTGADHRALAAAVALPDAPLVVLHPGASDPRRCWSPRRFAAVGDALAARGAAVAVTGSAGERDRVREVIEAMRRPALDLAGRLPLGATAALLRRAVLVISNDTGPLHLAEAIGTPSVGIFWALNRLNAEPLIAGAHRVAFSARMHCPVCGMENVRQRCGHDASFVDDVPVEEVLALAGQVFGGEDAEAASTGPIRWKVAKRRTLQRIDQPIRSDDDHRADHLAR